MDPFEIINHAMQEAARRDIKSRWGSELDWTAAREAASDLLVALDIPLVLLDGDHE